MIDVEHKRVYSMDSMGRDREQARNQMLGWIEAEHAKKYQTFPAGWRGVKKTVPRQMNGHDCGPFTCLFAAFMSNNKRMTFLQGDLFKMRDRIAWSNLHSL